MIREKGHLDRVRPPLVIDMKSLVLTRTELADPD
jgi:hypothetical protein